MKFKNAAWIWCNTEKVNQYADFLDFFYADKSVKTVLNISAKTDYAVFVNGIYVASGQYHDYPTLKVYDSIEITDFIVTGKNVLAIIGYTALLDTGSNIVNGSGIIFEVLAENKQLAFSSEKTLCRESLDYLSGDTFIVKGPIGYGLTYDFKKHDEWLLPGSNFADFKNAVITEVANDFILRPIKKLALNKNVPSKLITQGIFICRDGETAAEKMQFSLMSPKRIQGLVKEHNSLSFPQEDYIEFKHDGQEGIYLIIDLHKEITGHLSFDIELFEEADIDVGFGEHLDDLRVRTSIASNFAYEIKGKSGKNEFNTPFKRLGARYLQFFIHANHFKIKYAGITSATYPLGIVPYNTKSYINKKIYEVSINTLIQCMHEHYEDCPMREQAQYIMDSRTQMLCGYYAFNEKRFPRAALKLMGHHLNKYNNIPITTPSHNQLYIPCFTLVYFLALKEYVEHSNDASIITEMYGSCEIIMNHYLNAVQKNGLLKRQDDCWNFYEWTDGLVNWGNGGVENGETEYPAPLNAYFAIALESYAYLNKAIGNIEKANYLTGAAQKIKLTLHAHFWNQEKQLYCTYVKDNKQEHYCEYTQVILLYAGVTQKKGILLRTITQENDLQPLSLCNYIYKYDVLLQEGKKYVKYVNDDINKRWGGMLLNGATSFWETEQGSEDFSLAASLCHGWSAIPAYIYQKYNL